MFKNKSFMEIANTFVADITMAQIRLVDGVTNKLLDASPLIPAVDSSYIAPFLYEGHNALLLNIYWPPTVIEYIDVVVDHAIEEFARNTREFA